MPDTHIQTTVVVNRDWTPTFEKDDEVFTQLCAFHIFVDPIDRKKRCVVFTDDGMGNGLPILAFEME